MPEFEDGLRSALSDAAGSYAPSAGMVDHIEATITVRAHRKRRLVVAGSAGVLALSMGAAGASLIGTVATDSEPQAEMPADGPRSTTAGAPPTAPRGSTTTTPSTPAPSAAPGPVCPPTPSAEGNQNTARASWSPHQSSDDVRALARAATTGTPNTTNSSSSSSSSTAIASITTGNSTATNSSTSTSTSTNSSTSTSTSTSSSTKPPPLPPPAPPPLYPDSGAPAPSAGVAPDTTTPAPPPPAGLPSAC